MKPNSEPVLCTVQRARWEAMVISPVCMEQCSMALNRLKMQMLSERRETHCVDLITNISSPEHRIHNLLPDRVRDTRQRETRSSPNMYYNFKFRTERFKKSPLVYAINCYNSSLARS
jgi:hypothetical protein